MRRGENPRNEEKKGLESSPHENPNGLEEGSCHNTVKEDDKHVLGSHSKRKRKRSDHEDVHVDVEYENNKYLIEREWSKEIPKISKLKDLMNETFDKRSWIKDACPSATEVLEKYPCLLNIKIVRYKLKL